MSPAFLGIWWSDCWWCGVYSTKWKLARGEFRTSAIPIAIDTMDMVATVVCDDDGRAIELRRERQYVRERGSFIYWRRPGANTTIRLTPKKR